MQSFVLGFKDLLLAVPYLLARPRLFRFLIGPFLIALVVAGLLLWWMSGNVAPWVNETSSLLPGFLESWAGPVVRALLWAGFLALGYVLFLVAVAVLTTPFCEMLSEAVEEETTGDSGDGFSVANLLRDLVLGVVHAIRRVLLLLSSVIGLFLLSALIPVVGAFAGLVLGAWLTARFAAYDCFDTVWARKGTGYDDKTRFLREHRSYTTGLGLGVAMIALIPVLNTLALPLGTIAATRAHLILQRGSKPTS